VEVDGVVRKAFAMPRVSLNRPDLKLDPDDPPGFRAAMWRFGKSLGAQRIGTTLYEIPPDEAVCPYHYENAEEEWLLVLDGTPTLRDSDAESLRTWCAPSGPGGKNATSIGSSRCSPGQAVPPRHGARLLRR
jgi:hypothetical protein